MHSERGGRSSQEGQATNRLIGGELPCDEMKRVSPVMAPVFLYMWIFVSGLVLINMFVAIIAGAHAILAEQVLSGFFLQAIKNLVLSRPVFPEGDSCG